MKSKLQLVAVSYDSVEVLNEFGKRAKIRFALLSDKDSKVIDAYGIRNAEAKDSRRDGIPHPGTFIVDQDGRIMAKLFYPGYRERHGAQDIAAAYEKAAQSRKSE